MCVCVCVSTMCKGYALCILSCVKVRSHYSVIVLSCFLLVVEDAATPWNYVHLLLIWGRGCLNQENK